MYNFDIVTIFFNMKGSVQPGSSSAIANVYMCGFLVEFI